MTLREQAERRVDTARRMGRAPTGWIASEAALSELGIGAAGELLGLPVESGRPRSEWGLQLVLAA